MKGTYEELSLTNLGNGSANEIFLRELKEVIRNISDPNTDTSATRKITMEFVIKPNNDGDHYDIDINCKAKLAPIKAAKTFIATDGRDAYQLIKEQDMFDNVEDIKKDAKK